MGDNEDYSRERITNATKNFTNINRIVINMLKSDNKKVGFAGKRLTAGWDTSYMEKLPKI